MSAANNAVEREAAKVFLGRRNDRVIIDKIMQVVTKGLDHQHQGFEKRTSIERYLQRRKEETGYNKASNAAESEHSSDPEDERKDLKEIVHSNINEVKVFIKSSDTFKRFKEELDDFLNPFMNEAMWKRELWVSKERIRFELPNKVSQPTRIDKWKYWFEEKLGTRVLWWPLSQPRKYLPSDQVRMKLICMGHESFLYISNSADQVRAVVLKGI